MLLRAAGRLPRRPSDGGATSDRGYLGGRRGGSRCALNADDGELTAIYAAGAASGRSIGGGADSRNTFKLAVLGHDLLLLLLLQLMI